MECKQWGFQLYCTLLHNKRRLERAPQSKLIDWTSDPFSIRHSGPAFWTLFWPPSLENTVQNPVFRHSFYGNCLHICTDVLKNGANKKRLHIDIGGFSAHLSLAGVPCFGHSKCFLYSGKAPKTGPISDPGVLIRTRLIGSSGLLRSLALSSSCACGAIKSGP